MDEFEFNGNYIKRRDDGSFKVTTLEGAVPTMDKNGSTSASLHTIEGVGIENVFDAKTHTMARHGELTEHSIQA